MSAAGGRNGRHSGNSWVRFGGVEKYPGKLLWAVRQAVPPNRRIIARSL